MALYGPREPKPYDFVPLPDRVERAEPAGHDRFKRGALTGIITGELVAISAIHVASGNIELTHSDRIPLIKAHFRTGGRIAIPGSSLKGSARSIVEAVTYSCVRVQSRRARERLPRGFEPCEVRDENPRLCAACRLFGAMGYQGQVRFADAALIQGQPVTMPAPSMFAPRPDARLYYDLNGQVKGRKFYFHGQPAKGNVPLEVCGVGSRFSLRVDFMNLSEAELGILLVGLGHGNPSFALKLGGAKPACCGSAEMRVQCIETRDAIRDAVEFEAAVSPPAPGQWLAAAHTLLVRENFEKLHAIWRRDSQRSCPSRSY